MYMRTSCVNGCVVALDWYLPRMFFKSDVSEDARNMLRQKLIINI